MAAGSGGGRAAWGAYPRAKAAPRRPGCRARANGVGGGAASGGPPARDAPGKVKSGVGREGPQGACDEAGRRAGLRPCRCGKRGGGDRTGPDAGGATKRKRLAPIRKARHAVPLNIIPQRRVAGRFRCRYGVRSTRRERERVCMP